jgi:uncharacterized membrane protein YeaQ/YmgE (transglycosylase-associated protein family)
MLGLIWTVIIGFVVRIVAKLIMPGKENLGFIATTVLGIVGSLAATYIGQAVGWYEAGQGAGSRGARRITAGRKGEYYYTADHYKTFRRIKE